MTRWTRAALTVISAFIAYRVLLVWMPFVTALFIGVLVGIATNLITKPRESPADEVEAEEAEDFEDIEEGGRGR